VDKRGHTVTGEPRVLVWIVTAATILLILIRPKRIPEAIWACAGAALMVALRLLSPREAIAAAARGTDVYLFLTGMMILAELARREGFFDWIAVIAVNWARGSTTRLFAIIYAVGAVVTIFLSNDATAVVLTPAVLAALKKARANAIPYLFICAMIANAASFVLPISNPANLVLFGSKMPPLLAWVKMFALPSLVSIAVTFAVLRIYFRKDLAGSLQSAVGKVPLSPAGRRAAYGIAGAGIALIIASALNLQLGLPTFLTAVAAAAWVAMNDRDAPLGILRHISWSILPLVAGLFIMVAAVNNAGALATVQSLLRRAESGPMGALSSAFAVAVLCNIANNLPVGLIVGSAIHSGAVSEALRNALLIGVDVGPNLSVTGSLATILWLVALRRDGEDVSFWSFLKVGVLTMTPALALAVLASFLT
jgi:arsenical pump membrane protein